VLVHSTAHSLVYDLSQQYSRVLSFAPSYLRVAAQLERRYFPSRTCWSIFLLDYHSCPSCPCFPWPATVSPILSSFTILIEILSFREGCHGETTVEIMARLLGCHTNKTRNASSFIAIARAFHLSACHVDKDRTSAMIG